MPGYRGHLMGGIWAFFLMLPIVYYVGIPDIITLIEWCLCALAGSLFPDIDIKSKGQPYFYYAISFLFLILIWHGWHEAVSWCSLVAFLPLFVKHRGLFHRVWFVIGFPLAIFGAVHSFFPHMAQPILPHVLFFIGGALSHIFLDYRCAKLFKF